MKISSKDLLVIEIVKNKLNFIHFKENVSTKLHPQEMYNNVLTTKVPTHLFL